MRSRDPVACWTPTGGQPGRPDVINLIVALADSTFRTTLRWMLGHDSRFHVTEEVDSGDALVEIGADPDLLLVDLAIPGLNSYEAVIRFRSTHPATAIVVLASVEVEYLRRAMAAAGADDYIMLGAAQGDILDRLAIQAYSIRHSRTVSGKPLSSSNVYHDADLRQNHDLQTS